jgi:retinol-binding protein 3
MDKAPIEQIISEIEARYLFPEKAPGIINLLRQETFAASDEHELAARITEKLIEWSQDKHFLLRYAPDEVRQAGDPESLMKALGEQARLRNYGFVTLEWLAGNLGYWHLIELAPSFVAGDLLQAALSFLANSHAVILDLQGNRGGSPDMVQAIASQFLPPNQDLSGIQSKDAFTSYKTLEGMQALESKPLAILIDADTFSAAEALAYDLQCQRRGRIFGKRSKGGAHLSEFLAFDEKWLFRVPVARALNPITQDNWEAKGIIPDVESENALRDAQLYLLETLIAEQGASPYRPQWEVALTQLRA